jgi:hypothetical protein
MILTFCQALTSRVAGEPVRSCRGARLLDDLLPLLQEPPVAGRRRGAALEAERRHGDLPAVVDPADDVVFGAARVGEEDLVELGRAVDLGDRSDLDARLVHGHEQVADAGVLGRVGSVRTRQEDVVGVLGLGRPDLLAVDDPLVAVEHGGRLEAGQVRAGVGSEKPWHQAMVPWRMPGMNSLLLLLGAPLQSVGPTSVSPKKSARIGAPALANSSLSTTCWSRVSPLPPYSSGQPAQIQPPAKSFAVHSR